MVAWLGEVDGPSRTEALEPLAAEGVDHETAMIIDTGEGPIIVYAMQTDDLERSRAVTDESPRPVVARRPRQLLAIARDGAQHRVAEAGGAALA